MTFKECANMLDFYMKPVRSKTEYREYLFSSMEIKPEFLQAAEAIVRRMYTYRHRYQAVSGRYPNKSFKWYIVAVLHSMECRLDFNCYLGNGQSYSKKTTIEPKGRGPFRTWEAGAIDAINLKGFGTFDWSDIGAALWKIEQYNGEGYAKYHPEVNSPYLWSGTSHYTKGKYVKDGVYDPNFVSDQVGVAILLKLILMREEE